MTCAFDKEKLTGYFDGELEAADKAEVEKHISACSECLRDLGEIKSAAHLVRTLPRRRAPAAIAEAISTEIASARRIHSFSRYRKGILWTFAAAAAFLVVANVAYFSAREAPEKAGETPSGASAGIARIPADAARRDEAESRKNLAEPAPTAHGEELRRRAAAEETDKVGRVENGAGRKAGEPQAAFGRKADGNNYADGKPGAGKGDDMRENRAVAPGAAPKPAEPPVVADRPAPAKKATSEGLAKLEEKAAPPPAPPAAPLPAAKAPAADAEKGFALKDAQKAADESLGLKQQQLQADLGGAPSLQWTCSAPKGAAARAKAEEILAKKGWSSPVAANATLEKKALDKAESKAAFAEPARPGPLTVELTAAEFAELKKTLEAQSGTVLVAGIPDEAKVYRGAAPTGGLAGGGGKPVEEQSKGAAAAPARQESAQGGDLKRAKPAAPVEGAAKERESAEKLKELPAAEAAPVARRLEARQKYVLYFLDAPPPVEKKQ